MNHSQQHMRSQQVLWQLRSATLLTLIILEDVRRSLLHARSLRHHTLIFQHEAFPLIEVASSDAL